LEHDEIAGLAADKEGVSTVFLPAPGPMTCCSAAARAIVRNAASGSGHAQCASF